MIFRPTRVVGARRPRIQSVQNNPILPRKNSPLPHKLVLAFIFSVYKLSGVTHWLPFLCTTLPIALHTLWSRTFTNHETIVSYDHFYFSHLPVLLSFVFCNAVEYRVSGSYSLTDVRSRRQTSTYFQRFSEYFVRLLH